MTRDQIQSGLMDAERALSGLGPRPSGDAAALQALAREIRQEAETTAAAGRLERGIPESMTFVGPAADRFAEHAHDVAASAVLAKNQLDDAAAAIERAATRIAHAQHAYDRRKGDITERMRGLRRELAAAKP